MQAVTFEELPNAVARLQQDLLRIEELLLELKNHHVSRPPCAWLDVQGLSDYLPDKPARSTIYGWVNTSFIPYHKKSKKLSFLKSEIDQWLSDGRRFTLLEMKSRCSRYVSSTTANMTISHSK